MHKKPEMAFLKGGHGTPSQVSRLRNRLGLKAKGAGPSALRVLRLCIGKLAKQVTFTRLASFSDANTDYQSFERNI